MCVPQCTCTAGHLQKSIGAKINNTTSSSRHDLPLNSFLVFIFNLEKRVKCEHRAGFCQYQNANSFWPIFELLFVICMFLFERRISVFPFFLHKMEPLYWARGGLLEPVLFSRRESIKIKLARLSIYIPSPWTILLSLVLYWCLESNYLWNANNPKMVPI